MKNQKRNTVTLEFIEANNAYRVIYVAEVSLKVNVGEEGMQVYRSSALEEGRGLLSRLEAGEPP